MSSPVRLASFCRLCLSKTKDKVPVFANGNMLDNLLHLIEILIDPDDEPDAVVCYDCVVTLEGFHQFKEQCHVNDEFVKTVPPKLECSASSAEMAEEEDDDKDNREEGFLEEEELEEEDRLELSEAEEVFQGKPRQSARSKKKKITVKSPKKSYTPKPLKKRYARASTTSKQKQKQKEMSAKKATIDELQVLAESYPDFFYFEKGPRSIYYTIVFYGERFNSALFTERSTYWQCIHRRKYQCPAQVWVSNDYKTFERRFEHTHGELPEKEGQAFTPHEALPEMFQICKRIILQKRAKNVKRKVSFEDKFQEFATDTLETADDEDEPDNLANESKSSLTADDSDEEAEIVSDFRPKRKIKPNARYAAGANQPKKRALEPETKPKKQAIAKSEPKMLESTGKSKTRVVEKREPEVQETDEDEQEDDTIVEDDLDLDRIEEECEALKVPKKAPIGPPLDEQLVLADSYPDYFFFEKGPRSVYFTLVYYGERYHSALFTEHYTYWQCRHRRKYKCPAQVCVTNDYKTFERRYEHTHPDLPDKEGQAFTPMEALPDLFESCRKVVLKNRAKRRKKLLDKYKYLQTIEKSEVETPIEVQDGEEEDYDDPMEDEIMLKDVEYVEELIEVSED